MNESSSILNIKLVVFASSISVSID